MNTFTESLTQLVEFCPGEVWPDNNGVHINAHGGGILFHEGVYYWFGEHKIEGGAGNLALMGVHCYSSTDLYNWMDEGIALPVSNDPKSEIVRGCVIERPKVIYNAKTNKFVMWFHLELKGQGYNAARAALAVSDTVIGPYEYVGSFRTNPGVWPINASEADKQGATSTDGLSGLEAAQTGVFLRRDFEGGQMARDMTVFVDDDQKAYLITSAEENFTLNITELTDDYQGFSGRWSRIFPGGWNEAPALFKRGGKYYMITSGCTGWAPNPARSAVADSVLGPWTELGDPSRGTPEENAVTFWSQSTFVLPVQDREEAFIFMGDRWRPQNAIDGRYIWLPIEWEGDRPVLKWHGQWDLSVFDE
jgi:beta-xylosidase